MYLYVHCNITMVCHLHHLERDFKYMAYVYNMLSSFVANTLYSL